MAHPVNVWIWRLLDSRRPLGFELSNTPLEFRPMEGWVALSPGIPAHLFYFCRRGKLRTDAGSTRVDLSVGGSIWIPPGTPFRFECPEPDHTLIVRFRLKAGGPRQPKFTPKKDCLLGKLEGHGEIWIELLKQTLQWEGAGDTIALRSVLAGLVSGTFAGRKRRNNKAGRGRRFTSEEVRALDDWFAALPCSARPALGDLAGPLHLSPGYANELCRRSFGVSAERWLIMQRIRAAARQLEESTLSIGEIAERFGYSTLYFFSRQFRNVMKCSPREWRSRRRAF